MANIHNRRKFVKLSATALAGATILPAIQFGCNTSDMLSGVSVWDIPGGEFLSSPDYKVSLKRGSKIWTPLTCYSRSKGVDKIIDHEEEGKYVKLGFRRLQSGEYISPENNKDTYAHSWAYFDFSGGPVEVEIKILRPIEGITLPLKSCAVFPSTLGIDCEIAGDDVIRFTIDKPAKIAIVPNHHEALMKLQGLASKQAFEGYRNPLFLFARSPETDVPAKDAEGTLLVKPGEQYEVEDFNKAKIIYFEAGVHDYSKYNPDDPNHYIYLLKGQTVYLEGGAFLYAIFNSDIEKPLIDMPLVRGRGIISGDRQPWTGRGSFYNLVKRVCMNGIHITDPHNHVTHDLGFFKDVAVVGAWHGNTDGIGRNVRTHDSWKGWHAEDCFCMAADTNLVIGGIAKVKNHTLWQLNNAEPVWIRHSEKTVADGINIIAYNKSGDGQRNRGQAFNFTMDYRTEGYNNNILMKNIVVDAPFIPCIFRITTSITTDELIYENVVFENIVVNTPEIHFKSPIGSIGKKNSNFGRVVFRNLVIQGVKVTRENFTDYFDVLNGVSLGKEIIIE
jgi:hypothetical protein